MKPRAYKIKKLKRWKGEAALYKLSEPVAYRSLWDTRKTSFVIVTALIATTELNCETLIFASNENAKVLDRSPLHGSLYDDLNPVEALNNMGYEVVWKESDL